MGTVARSYTSSFHAASRCFASAGSTAAVASPPGFAASRLSDLFVGVHTWPSDCHSRRLGAVMTRHVRNKNLSVRALHSSPRGSPCSVRRSPAFSLASRPTVRRSIAHFRRVGASDRSRQRRPQSGREFAESWQIYAY